MKIELSPIRQKIHTAYWGTTRSGKSTLPSAFLLKTLIKRMRPSCPLEYKVDAEYDEYTQAIRNKVVFNSVVLDVANGNLV